MPNNTLSVWDKHNGINEIPFEFYDNPEEEAGRQFPAYKHIRATIYHVHSCDIMEYRSGKWVRTDTVSIITDQEKSMGDFGSQIYPENMIEEPEDSEYDGAYRIDAPHDAPAS